MLKQVAVVIPCYKEELTHNEFVSLQQAIAVLGKYPVRVVAPDGLVLASAFGGFEDIETINFDADYFTGISGYNRLMMSAAFYHKFAAFEYILIYQLDAFVFRDDLQLWCDKGYDYIGSPWLPAKINRSAFKSLVLPVQRSLSYHLDLKKKSVPNKYQFENRVGNGGFSLRRVAVFEKICIEMKAQIERYLSKAQHQYNEDVFWSLEVNRQKKQLAIPGWQEALNFSFETYPQNALKLNNDQLPFGCHDWDHYPDFWQPIFKKLGYEI